MSLTLEAERHRQVAMAAPTAAAAEPTASTTPGFQVIRRNGAVTPFDPGKISVALTKAFLAVEGGRAAASRRVHEVVEELTQQVVAALTRRGDAGRTFHIEDIQDQVELALMRGEHHKVARAYVLYREERAASARAAKPPTAGAATPALHVKRADGTLAPLDDARLARVVERGLRGPGRRLGRADPRRDAAQPLRRHHAATNWRWRRSWRRAR